MSEVLMFVDDFKLMRIVTERELGKRLMLFTRYEMVKGSERVAGHTGGNDKEAIKWFKSELKNRYNLC